MLFFDLFRHEPTFTHIRAGETLFHEGDTGTFMYVLIVGTAQILVQKHAVERLIPGGIAGEGVHQHVEDVVTDERAGGRGNLGGNARLAQRREHGLERQRREMRRGRAGSAALVCSSSTRSTTLC